MLPCQLPEFDQCIDHTRGFELLDQDAHGRPTTAAPERRPHLRYRYTDDGEIIVVPNTHYNLTPQARAQSLRYAAQEREDKAKKLLRSTPADWKPWMAQQVAERYLLNAHRIRQVAARIEAGKAPWDAHWGLEAEEAWWPKDVRERDQPLQVSVGAWSAHEASLTDVPLKQSRLQQLRCDAENVQICADRKGLTFSAAEMRDQAFTAVEHFALGCWLSYYSQRLGSAGSERSTRDRTDCVRRLFKAGIAHPHDRFLAVFDFGSRQFEAYLEMEDAGQVVELLRTEAHGAPRSKLADCVRAMGWWYPTQRAGVNESVPSTNTRDDDVTTEVDALDSDHSPRHRG